MLSPDIVKLNVRQLSALPNSHGFEFLGVRQDGSVAACLVVRDEATGIHSVAGEASFTDLKFWIPYA